MDNRRYLVKGTNNYVCVALDAKTVADCVGNFLASNTKTPSHVIRERMDAFRRWAAAAQCSQRYWAEEFIAKVVDADDLRRDGALSFGSNL